MQIRVRMCRNSSVGVARCWTDLARVIKLNPPQGDGGRHSVEQGDAGGSPEAKYSNSNNHPEGKYAGISEAKYPTSNQYQEFPPAYPGGQQMPGAGRLHYPASDYPVGSIYDQPGYPNSSPSSVQDFQVGLSRKMLKNEPKIQARMTSFGFGGSGGLDQASLSQYAAMGAHPGYDVYKGDAAVQLITSDLRFCEVLDFGFMD